LFKSCSELWRDFVFTQPRDEADISKSVASVAKVTHHHKMSDAAPIEAILDELHAAAREAYSRKDVDAYREIFCADLEYQRVDGRVIDRAQLMRDVKAQFQKLDKADTTFVREEFSLDGKQATAVLSQTACADAVAFGFIRRSWCLRRRGHYTWATTDGVWKIARVRVLSEEIRSSGWRLGR